MDSIYKYKNNVEARRNIERVTRDRSTTQKEKEKEEITST